MRSSQGMRFNRPNSAWRGGCGLSIILGGLVLIVVSALGLIWNEYNSVSTYRTLVEGAAIVKTIPPVSVDPANDGKLAHMVGEATTTDTVVDPDTGISTVALKLRRKVEMYQWSESKNSHKDSNGNTYYTYSYSTGWYESFKDSSSFNEGGHQNPPNMPYKSATWPAAKVSLGAYTLSSSLLDQINQYQTLTVSANPGKLDRKVLLWQGGLYLGDNPDSPKVGDIRIRYDQVLPTTISIISQIAGGSFVPFRGKAGGTIDLLQTGEHSADDMIATAQENNVIGTWAFRAIGAFLMMIGFQMLGQPLGGLLRLIPFLGGVAERTFGCLTAIVAIVLALPLSAVIILAAWVFFHAT